MMRIRQKTLLVLLVFLLSALPAFGLPGIEFVEPTAPGSTQTTNTSVEINVSITEANLGMFTWNWNDTNYSFYGDDLIMMFNFDNNTAIGENDTTAVDVSMYGNNGTFINEANYTTDGVYGSAATFDGTGDYIALGDIDLESIFTVSAWILNNDSSGDYINNRIFQKKTVWNGVNGWSVEFGADQEGKGDIEVIGSGSTNVNLNCVTDWQTTDLNTWVHVTVVFNGDTATTYCNGVQKESGAIDSVVNNNVALWVGAIPSEANSWNGSIDEVRIYKRSLSSNEIAQLYMSNLQKYDTNQWSFYTNQSKLTGPGLDNGTYTYFGAAQDSSGNENATEQRSIIIGGECSPTLNSDWVVVNPQVCNGVNARAGTGSIIIGGGGILSLVNGANVTASGLELVKTGDRIFINRGSEVRIN